MRNFLRRLAKAAAWSVGTVTVLAVAAIGYIWLFVANFDGYCDELGRVTTDRELILAGITNELGDIQKPDGGTYESAEEFLKEHSNCCKVDRHSNLLPEKNASRFFGMYSVVARIAYISDSRKPGKYVDVILYISPCGQVLDRS